MSFFVTSMEAIKYKAEIVGRCYVLWARAQQNRSKKFETTKNRHKHKCLSGFLLVDTMEKRFLIFLPKECQVLKRNQILRRH